MSNLFLSLCLATFIIIASVNAFTSRSAPICLNGGIRINPESTTLSSKLPPCRCPQQFHGSQCQYPRCFNGGTLVQLDITVFKCHCPHSPFIDGKHCEIVRCIHGTSDAYGRCQCHDFAVGSFCEQIDHKKIVGSLQINVTLMFLTFAVVVLFIVCIRLLRKSSFKTPLASQNTAKTAPPDYFL